MHQLAFGRHVVCPLARRELSPARRNNLFKATLAQPLASLSISKTALNANESQWVGRRAGRPTRASFNLAAGDFSSNSVEGFGPRARPLHRPPARRVAQLGPLADGHQFGPL